MEWWYLLVAVPIIQIGRALVEAWHLLLEASDDQERQQIVSNAGAKAFVNTLMAVGIAVAPWPYNLLGLLPAVFPLVMNGLASLLGIAAYWKFHGKF